jgi:MFS family permease
MIRLASPTRHAPRPSSRCAEAAKKKQPETLQVLYGMTFWLAYGSNCLVMVAVALLYRYADFITLLGGTELHLGWIVGVGMIGSLIARMILGSSIDLYGAKLIWLGSILLLAATCFAHLAVSSYNGVAVYLLRVLFCCAFAGVNGASLTFVSGRGPTKRMAELIGMLGTAGFLGTVVGTALGDLLFSVIQSGHMQIVTMFVGAGVLTLLSFPFAWLASRSELRPKPTPGPSMLSVLRRHHPGSVLLVSVAMGIGLGMPCVFLRPFAAQLDIPRISLFFLVYSMAAIITRILTRRWAERFGLRPLILLGTLGIAASMALFLLVHTEWQLIWPAVAFGCFHAILYPSVVAASNVTFPARHRGLATLLVLAAFDTGQLAGAPMAGVVLHYSESSGLPPYPTMFLTTAVLLALVGVYYALAQRRKGVVG